VKFKKAKIYGGLIIWGGWRKS